MEPKRQTHIIDAKAESLGRVAVKAANLLRGKGKTDFEPYRDMGDFVVVKNIKEIKITGRKEEQKIYYHHSGYLGGLREKPLGKLLAERPDEVMRKAIWGMLPKNKLRGAQIKRLKVEL